MVFLACRAVLRPGAACRRAGGNCVFGRVHFDRSDAVREMPRVLIMQSRLVQYRVRLFSLMRSELERHGVDLVLVHGQASRTERHN